MSIAALAMPRRASPWAMRGSVSTIDDARRELGGRTLACWCALDQPCHAEVLLRLANEDRGHA
jgi:hypothetical protein